LLGRSINLAQTDRGGSSRTPQGAGEVKEFLLITFREVRPMLTGHASDYDEVVQEVIDSIEAAFSDPMRAANDPEDEIATAQVELRATVLIRDGTHERPTGRLRLSHSVGRDELRNRMHSPRADHHDASIGRGDRHVGTKGSTTPSTRWSGGEWQEWQETELQ
jgi:hypothetical protein